MRLSFAPPSFPPRFSLDSLFPLSPPSFHSVRMLDLKTEPSAGWRASRRWTTSTDASAPPIPPTRHLPRHLGRNENKTNHHHHHLKEYSLCCFCFVTPVWILHPSSPQAFPPLKFFLRLSFLRCVPANFQTTQKLDSFHQHHRLVLLVLLPIHPGFFPFFVFPVP